MPSGCGEKKNVNLGKVSVDARNNTRPHANIKIDRQGHKHKTPASSLRNSRLTHAAAAAPVVHAHVNLLKRALDETDCAMSHQYSWAEVQLCPKKKLKDHRASGIAAAIHQSGAYLQRV